MPRHEELAMSGPGVAPARIKEVDELAESYIRERDKRMRQTPRESDAKKAFISSLHKHEKEIGRDNEGVLRYEFEGLVFELKMTEEKLSVRKVEAEDED